MLPKLACRLSVVAALLLGGCAGAPTKPGAAPLPDARQLSEDPLDVINLPQP